MLGTDGRARRPRASQRPVPRRRSRARARRRAAVAAGARGDRGTPRRVRDVSTLRVGAREGEPVREPDGAGDRPRADRLRAWTTRPPRRGPHGSRPRRHTRRRARRRDAGQPARGEAEGRGPPAEPMQGAPLLPEGAAAAKRPARSRGRSSPQQTSAAQPSVPATSSASDLEPWLLVVVVIALSLSALTVIAALTSLAALGYVVFRS